MGTQYSGVICNYFIVPILISTVQHTLLTELRTGVTIFSHVVRKKRTTLEKAIVQGSLQGKRR